MIKPDWKPVSELQNMTYEEYKKLIRSMQEYFIFAPTIDGTKNFVENVAYMIGGRCLWDNEEDFQEKRRNLDHLYFAHDGVGIYELSSVTHYAPFDVAPPEEE